MKAEELKQKAKINKADTLNAGFITFYIFSEQELQQYTDEVSLEAEKRGIERGKVIGEHGCESWIE